MILRRQFMEIKCLHKQGLTNTKIAEILGVTRKTVYNNLKKNIYQNYKRKKILSKLDDYKDYIKKRLDNYNLSSHKLYKEIKKMGYKGKYGIVNNFVQEVKNNIKQTAYIRFETLPGEQAQVDWGYIGKIYDRKLKKEVKVYCFVIVLGYSRTLYVEFFTDMKIHNFLKGHNNAFKYFGGYTREILYDNLKSVVINRKLKAKDSEYNKKFIDFASYYGFKPILCRPYKPETKGKVEKMVDYVKKDFCCGEIFNSVKEMNELKEIWLKEANSRIHQTTKKVPFDLLKKEVLISLKNKKLYDTSIIYYRKVYKDIHFSFKTNRYSVPYKYAGKEIALKENGKNLEVYYRDELILVHQLILTEQYIYITKDEHTKALIALKYKNYSKSYECKNKQKNEFNPNAVHILNKVDNNEVQKRSLNEYEGEVS